MYILKWNHVLFEQLHLLEPSMCQYLFLINYKHFQAAQNYSSQQPYTLFRDQKQVFLPFNINNIYMTIK